jgi:hypothetical protein
LEDLFKGDFKDKDDDVVEEIRLPNGQLQSRFARFFFVFFS